MQKLLRLPNSTYLKQIRYNISVYQGISPSLLATMSLSQGIKGKTNQQLITSLMKSNIIRNKQLQAVMKIYDRKYFIDDALNKDKRGSYYQNRPYKIRGGQNMTDIFTHAVILERMAEQLQNMVKDTKNKDIKQLRILDIGTGHGYLAYVISSLVSSIFSKNKLRSYIHGIDSNSAAIQYSTTLLNKFKQQKIVPVQDLQNIQFKAEDLEDVLKRKQKYDFIIGGFYMPPAMHQQLISMIQENNGQLGIWAADSNSGQSLFSFTLDKQKQSSNGKPKLITNQIMSTMFSMPTTKTSVSKYFIQDSEQPQNDTSSYQSNQQQIRKHLQEKNTQKRRKQLDELKQKIKIACEKQNSLAKKKLSLEELKKIKYINQMLENMRKLQSMKNK